MVADRGARRPNGARDPRADCLAHYRAGWRNMTANGRHRQGTGRRGADAALIAALASGATREDAARVAGVSPRTVYRRVDTEAFRRRVDEAREEIIASATGRLAAATQIAVDTLVELVTPSEPASV